MSNENNPFGEANPFADPSIQNAAKNVQGQFRATKDALESRLKEKLSGEHQARRVSSGMLRRL